VSEGKFLVTILCSLSVKLEAIKVSLARAFLAREGEGGVFAGLRALRRIFK
jgi:hypothetical protein